MTPTSLHVVSAALCLAWFGGCSSPEAESGPRFDSQMVEGEPMYTVLEPDRIAAIDEPVFVTAAEADTFFQPHEPVLGVVGKGGTAKAYSAWHLEDHEIVNDTIDGEPIATTW